MPSKKDSEADVEDGDHRDDGPVMKQPKFKDDLKACFFLAVHNSSIGDLVTHSLTD